VVAPDAAAIWESLLRGRSVVTEHLVGASARSIQVRPVAGPPHAHASAHHATETHVAGRRARGESLKALALDLGWSHGGVRACIASAMRKLWISSDLDLVLLLREPSPRGLTATRVGLGADDPVVFTVPIAWALPACLSPAEQDVALEVVAGQSQKAIAQARRTSPRTIANQVGSIFRKLGVHSRIEFLGKLHPR
jgi:DNA-binding NarL/FixJ family response regulator